MKILATISYWLLSIFAAPPEYATVSFRNAGSHQYIETGGDLLFNEKYKDSALLQLSGMAAAPWQKWHLIYQATINGIKYYHIRNLHSGKLVTPGKAAVMQRSAGNDDEQLWKLESITSDQYRIVNKKNGLALAAVDDEVVQEKPAGKSNQYWQIHLIAAEAYRDDEVVRFFNRNNTSQGSAAFDQGNSIPLTWGANKGKVLWITQDAWDGEQLKPNNKFKCKDFHRYSNSVLIQPSKADWNPDHTPNITINNSTSNKPKQVFNIAPGTAWTWAGPGIEIGDKVYVHCGEGKGLDATGQSLYRLTQNAGLEWAAERFMPNGLENLRPIIYSCGMVKPGDGYVYVFGREGINYNYACYMHVARFRESNPLQWEYYNGTAWTDKPSPGAASKIADGKGSVSIDYLNGKYILMTMDQGFNCETSRNIYIATSGSPTGPFTTPTLVYTIREYFKGKYARYYTPVVHPEFNNGRKELLLTYCLNFSGCQLEPCEGDYMDPYYYRVKGIRVPYAVIGL